MLLSQQQPEVDGKISEVDTNRREQIDDKAHKLNPHENVNNKVVISDPNKDSVIADTKEDKKVKTESSENKDKLKAKEGVALDGTKKQEDTKLEVPIIFEIGTQNDSESGKIGIKTESVSGKQIVENTEDDTQAKNTKDTGMLSFTEWKLKLDREKEEVEQIEQIIVVNTTTNETVVVAKPKKRKKKMSNKKNYASPNCGAKVVAANKEAQHVPAILKEDKDAYMLNPCNARAWLVVELCERIQLDSIDFANFEMFSSTPALFTVHVSNRFPTRDWDQVQEGFEAKAGRQVQNFPIKEIFYAKYIKVCCKNRCVTYPFL